MPELLTIPHELAGFFFGSHSVRRKGERSSPIQKQTLVAGQNHRYWKICSLTTRYNPQYPMARTALSGISPSRTKNRHQENPKSSQKTSLPQQQKTCRRNYKTPKSCTTTTQQQVSPTKHPGVELKTYLNSISLYTYEFLRT